MVYLVIRRPRVFDFHFIFFYCSSNITETIIARYWLFFVLNANVTIANLFEGILYHTFVVIFYLKVEPQKNNVIFLH